MDKNKFKNNRYVNIALVGFSKITFLNTTMEKKRISFAKPASNLYESPIGTANTIQETMFKGDTPSS